MAPPPPLDIEKMPYASEEQVSKMQACFEKFDRDGGGSIDVHELKAALNDMGKDPSDKELEQMMNDADKARHSAPRTPQTSSPVHP